MLRRATGASPEGSPVFGRLLILCLLLTMSLIGCAAPQRDVRSEAIVCADGPEPPQKSRWLPFSGEDGQYGALMCTCYALVLAAAAAGAWWAWTAADAANRRGDFP